MRETNHESGCWAAIVVCAAALATFWCGAQAGMAASSVPQEKKAERDTVKVTLIEGTQSFPIYIL